MKADKTSRLFLALWPDATIRAALGRCRDAWRWDAGARPEPDERLHLTLHFLGAVPQRKLPDLLQGLQVRSDRFSMALDSPVRWPSGVAVLQPSAMPAALLQLHADLGNRLELLGIQVDSRPFRPHVTLARKVAVSTLPPSDACRVHWSASGFALVQSMGGKRGYVVLRHFDGPASPGSQMA
jgi:2'-5' RNA ligase